MTPDELLLMIAERAQQRNVTWHIENYPATRSAAERLLRTMNIVPAQRALPVADNTMLLPLYERGVARYER